jgi:hypothetical protein
MIKDKTGKKKPSQSGLTWLTHDLRYNIGITSQKEKRNKSWISRPNNLMSNDKIKKKIISKKEPKKRSRLNQVNI